MKNSIRKFLEFNGKVISFVDIDGQYWIAIRPICAALNVKYAWHLERLKKHRIWGHVYRKQGMRDSKNRLQKMVALPERFIYMWIAQLPIKTDEHAEFVLECVDVIFDYLHGGITGRKEALNRKADIQLQKKELRKELMESEKFRELMGLEAQEMREGKILKALDQKLISKQINLFSKEDTHNN